MWTPRMKEDLVPIVQEVQRFNEYTAQVHTLKAHYDRLQQSWISHVCWAEAAKTIKQYKKRTFLTFGMIVMLLERHKSHDCRHTPKFKNI